MFSRKPSRTVTGAAAAASALAVLPVLLAGLDDEDEEQPAARSRTAPVIAATVTRRIRHTPKSLITTDFIGNILGSLYIESVK